MNKEKTEKLEKLQEIKLKAETDLKNNHIGYENCIVKNVIHYNKKVELINKQTKQKEEFDLCVAVVEDPETKRITNMYYLNGEEVDFTELLMQYESPEPIKDVVDKTKENEEKAEKEQDKELVKDDLNELENEKQQEEKEGKNKEDKTKNDLTGTKPKYVLQTIDIDKAYVDNWTTVRKGFELPAGVEKIAIATPMQKDDHILQGGITMYMLDARGNILENVNGKTIKDYFEIDDATGINPMYDDNTKLELQEHAEKNKGMTMRRFKSKQNPELYLSAEQKEVGQYVEVYAGKRTRNGNDPVEVQLETNNVGIQTSLEMQQIISGYKGEYNVENIDKEADIHEAHGDDEMKIAKENADGIKHTKEICESPYVPDTEITWEQLSKLLGNKNIEALQVEFLKEYNGNNSEKIILEMQEEYGEEEKKVEEPIEEKEIEDEYEGRVPWDSTKH